MIRLIVMISVQRTSFTNCIPLGIRRESMGIRDEDTYNNFYDKIGNTVKVFFVQEVQNT